MLLLGIFLLVIQTKCLLAQEGASEDNAACLSPHWGRLCPTEEKLHRLLQHTEERLSHRLAQVKNRIDVTSLLTEDKAKQLRIPIDTLQSFENDSAVFERVVNNIAANVGYKELIQNASDNIATMAENDLESLLNKSQFLLRKCLNSHRKKNLEGIRIPTLSGKDCADIYRKGGRESGFYYIRPVEAARNIQAYCDMDDRDGGWTVIQQRFDGSVDFDRDWESYKWGFGDKIENGEYWLGNEYIHMLTMQNVTELQIDMVAWDNTRRYALYKYFQIDNENNKYRLRKVNGYFMDQNGDVGNALERGSGFSCLNSASADLNDSSHKSMYFTTKDRDNDGHPENCAGNARGGWWYNHCLSANLNGKRRREGEPAQLVGGDTDGMVWTTWRGCFESLKKSRMKVRPFGFRSEEIPIMISAADIRRRLENRSSKIARRLQRRRWRRHSRHRRKSGSAQKDKRRVN